MEIMSKIEIEPSVTTQMESWFDEYCRSFPLQDDDLRQNFSLKQEHTKKVCEEIVAVGTELDLDRKALALAWITALLHDVGRFEQYLRYRTFVDRRSVNHAEFGVKILQEKKVLAGLDNGTRKLILDVITYHNRAVIPDTADPVCLFFSRLLRDADKLDIYRVVTDCYRQSNGKKNPAVQLDLPDLPEISPDVLHNFLDHRVIRHDQLNTLNDFKLLQLGWVFDINFIPSLRRIRDRKFIETIYGSLKGEWKTGEIMSVINDYVHRRINNGGMAGLAG